MIRVSAEMRRLSHSLVTGGALTLALGFGAVVWPEILLIPALLLVGAIAALFGAYQAATAVAIRRRASRWWLALAHGLAVVAFGLLTVGAAGPKLEIALFFIAAWLALYAAITWRAATLSKGFPRVRRALSLFASLNAVLAIIVLSYGATTIFAVLYLGAVYAAVFGVWQLTAGIGLARMLRSHEGRKYDGVIVTAEG